MTIEGARRAPARAASPFPLWCKGGKRRREDQAKAPISVQQDQDQSNGGKEGTMEPRTASPQGLWQAKTNFSQDKCTRCSPSNWPIVGALPAQYLGRGPGPLPINRTRHPQGRGIASGIPQREGRAIALPLAVHPLAKNRPSRGCSSLYCSSSSAQEAIHPPQTRVGYYTTTVARTSINPVSLVLFFQ